MNCSGGLCALFLCPVKGSDNLKNTVFMQKTAEEKRKHLAAVLRYAAGGSLDDEMIGRILPKVAIHRQYTVSAFTEDLAFQEAISHAISERAQISIVYSRIGCSTVAVVIEPRESAAQNKWAIFIYSPNPYFRKGMEQWARASKNG